MKRAVVVQGFHPLATTVDVGDFGRRRRRRPVRPGTVTGVLPGAKPRYGTGFLPPVNPQLRRQGFCPRQNSCSYNPRQNRRNPQQNPGMMPRFCPRQNPCNSAGVFAPGRCPVTVPGCQIQNPETDFSVRGSKREISCFVGKITPPKGN